LRDKAGNSRQFAHVLISECHRNIIILFDGNGCFMAAKSQVLTSAAFGAIVVRAQALYSG